MGSCHIRRDTGYSTDWAGSSAKHATPLAAYDPVREPVGVICHGPWTLVEADVVQGRTLTSYPSVRTDIRNAGGNVVDQEVVTDQNITFSRWPEDLPAFCARIVEQFARRHYRQGT